MDDSNIAEIEDIRDEIALKEAILESLEQAGSSDEDEDERQTTRRELKRLRKCLRILLHPNKKEENDDNEPSQTLNQIPEFGGEALSRQEDDYLKSPSFKLVSRKRRRDDLEAGDGQPESSKSRRATPSPAFTAAASPDEAYASDGSLDDANFDAFFGLSKEEAEENRAFWNSREDKRKQEEHDARLAQSLSQGWDEPVRPPTANADMSQSFLKTDGSINARNVPPAVKPEPSANYSTSTRIKPEPVSYQPLRGIKPEPLAGALIKSEPKASNLSFTNSIPGAFPGQAYSSYGGQPVYHIPDEDDPPLAGAGVFAPGAAIGYGLDSPANGHVTHEQHEAELRGLLQHIRPDEELTADDMPPQPAGMKVPLMPHQLSGLAWMKKMEEAENTKGGILADDMGLGKTIQAIALILERRPTLRRPTLVVAPVALMQQWKREIEKMVRSSHRQEVLILHGNARNLTWTNLKAYDVVITTYGLLASELKRKLALEERAKRVKNFQPAPGQDCPVLGDQSQFHRVILDEAQNIKNRAVKTAIAACRIEAKHRWCLTGTPMQNNVEELYSLIKFLRVRPYCEWNRFRVEISAPLKRKYEVGRERAMTALQAVLRVVLLRRSKTSTIHGQPILQLPPKEIREDRVEFDKDQREFYFALERSSQIQMNRYLQKGTMGRHYANALVLLLRLRQACCHPHLVIASKDFVQLPGGELDGDALLRNAANLDAKVVDRLKSLEAYECPICLDPSDNPSVFFCGHFICGDCLSRLTDDTNNNGGRPKCPHCRADIDVNNVTDYTSFLKVHCPEQNEDNEGQPAAEEADSDTDSDTDAEDIDDSDEGGDLSGFIVYDSDDNSARPSKHVGKKAKSGSKPKSKSKVASKSREPLKSLAQLRKESLKNKAARKKYLKRLRKTCPPSAKIERTIELLQEIKNRGEGEKTIIFSNFTSFLDIIETQIYDKKELQHHVRYDGSMSAQARNDAVLEFTENPRCSAMLISLKAGNAGLNLTVANHVIMLDPFWNPFVEYQAADRCYRIGQMRTVTVHRLFIGAPDGEGISRTEESEETSDGLPKLPEDNGYTVEDRILQLQEKKRRLVETALDENAGREVSRLGMRELGFLFGLNRL